MRAAIYITAALLAGCYPVPSDAVPGDPLARRLALESFEDARDPLPECPYLDTVYVVETGDEGMRAACHRVGAVGCVYLFSSSVGEQYTLTYVHRGLTGRSRYAVEIHEILHAARNCWVYPDGQHADLERFTLGHTETCRSVLAMDERHCDNDLWVDIESEAVRRYEEATFALDGGM